jgi:DNA polymerase V
VYHQKYHLVASAKLQNRAVWQGRGVLMVEAGIRESELLQVNRALAHQHLGVVVAEVDGEFTARHFCQRAGWVSLRAANPTFPPILLK